MKTTKPDPSSALERERYGLVRVAAVAPALKLGDVDENVARSVAAVKECAAAGCRLVVLPELGLTGYSCGDLFFQEGLLQRVRDGVAWLVAATREQGCCVVVGLPWQVRDRLYNVAAVLAGGRLLGVVPKSVLPNSGEFYERRWFSPAATVVDAEVRFEGGAVPFGTDLIFEAAEVPGLRIGVELCEDLWSVVPPSSLAALGGATVLVNLSASNEVLGKAAYRRQLVQQQAARCLAAYVYASAGPGESSTDVVFSGHCLIAENGVLLAESERFDFAGGQAVADVDVQWLEQDRLHSSSFRDEAPGAVFRRVSFELGSPVADGGGGMMRQLPATPFIPRSEERRREVCEEIFAIQATGLARRLKAARAATAVVGLSGGLDSTLAFLVMVRAAEKLGWKREQLVAVTMPGFGTSGRTRGNAEALAGAFGVTLRTVSIEAAVRQHFADIGHPEGVHDVVFENAQARERTQVLMDVANQVGGIVVGTGDLSEAALGWCTFNGDHMSMYHVNAGVPKTLVRYLIEWCAEDWCREEAGAVLHDIVDTPISPELLPLGSEAELVQKTEEVVGPYELHDFFLFHLVRHGASREKIRFLASQAFAGSALEDQVEKWLAVFLRRFAQNQFKRSVMPDGPKVGSVALSPRGDWRMPSDWMGEVG
jgi:NAD+ synthase (glutamine-hydrolysing)